MVWTEPACLRAFKPRVPGQPDIFSKPITVADLGFATMSLGRRDRWAGLGGQVLKNVFGQFDHTRAAEPPVRTIPDDSSSSYPLPDDLVHQGKDFLDRGSIRPPRAWRESIQGCASPARAPRPGPDGCQLNCLERRRVDLVSLGVLGRRRGTADIRLVIKSPGDGDPAVWRMEPPVNGVRRSGKSIRPRATPGRVRRRSGQPDCWRRWG